MKGSFAIAALFTLLLTAPFSTNAQSTAGRLVGTVLDPNGAAVPGADVTVTDNATQRARTVKTNDQGLFSVPQLEFGTYTVTVAGSGFKNYTATEVKIDVGRDYTLHIQLEPGGFQENVTVVAGADVVNATSTT